jgi:tRNA-dihydrouridine synthase A
MMGYTDRHFRYLMRLIAPHTRLYTEMVTGGALTRGQSHHLIEFNPEEHPVALQVGGSDPEQLAACARLGHAHGYDEINLNCGCPSPRVSSGRFGACLMAEPVLVAECVAAMRASVPIPITVKTRLGIDDLDSYEHLHKFVATVARQGCVVFIVHARKAWLSGLSPHENRTVPPLDHERVYRLKRDFPDLTIVINGGITTATEALRHLAAVDGVMIGRLACQDSHRLAVIEQALFGNTPRSRLEIAAAYRDYAAGQLELGVAAPHLCRPLLGLFHGEPGARRWRRLLSEARDRSDIGMIDRAIEVAKKNGADPRVRPIH